MSKKERRLLFSVVAAFAILILTGIIAVLRFDPGLSLDFYLSTGLRLPRDARLITKIENYPGEYSNEGETYYAYKVQAQDIAGYLSSLPWKNVKWEKGPVPNYIRSNSGQIEDRFDSMLDSPHVWYLAQSRKPDPAFWDGQILVIDPKTNIVFFCEWNH